MDWGFWRPILTLQTLSRVVLAIKGDSVQSGLSLASRRCPKSPHWHYSSYPPVGKDIVLYCYDLRIFRLWNVSINESINHPSQSQSNRASRNPNWAFLQEVRGTHSPTTIISSTIFHQISISVKIRPSTDCLQTFAVSDHKADLLIKLCTIIGGPRRRFVVIPEIILQAIRKGIIPGGGTAPSSLVISAHLG